MEVKLAALTASLAINWQCTHTWRRASYNTPLCLIGCSIGDLGTIAYFQITGIPVACLGDYGAGDFQRLDDVHLAGDDYSDAADGLKIGV